MTGVFATSGGQAHQTAVSGLANGQSYAFYVRCEDAEGNANQDDYGIDFLVDTPVPAPATIAITSPAQGANLSGVVAITAAATGSNLLGVAFFVDGEQQGGEDTAAPFSINWDSATQPSGPVAVTARLRYGSPQQTLESAAVNVTIDNSPPPAGGGGSVIRLNAGRMSGVYTDALGQIWDTDRYFRGGGLVSAPTVSGTPEIHLYRVARSSYYTDFGWDIPVEPGRYTVTLKFAETYYSKPAQRTFDVKINGTTVLDDFDIVLEAGAWRTALDRSFTVDAPGGLIVLDFLRESQFGIVSAIEITPAP
jgi:hypothetical protein